MPGVQTDRAGTLESDLKASEERHRRLARAAVEVARATSVDDALRIVTEQAAALIGARRAETSLLEADGSSTSQRARHTADGYQGESGGSLLAPMIARDGSTIGLIELHDKVQGAFDDRDEFILVQFAQMAAAAVENARLHEAVADRENRLKLVTSLLPACIAYIDANLVYRWVSETYREWLGVGPETLIGRKMTEMLSDEDLAQRRPFLERVLAGENVRYEMPFTKADGRRVISEGLYIPDRQGDTVAGFVAMVRDVTEERAAAAALQRSEARLRGLLEASTIGIAVNDRTGRFTYANAPFLRMLGYDAADIASGQIAWSRIQCPDRLEDDDLALDQLRATGSCEPYETELTTKDGRRVPVYIGAAFLPGDGEEGLLGACFVTDLTQLKEAENALRALNEELDARVRERTVELQRANDEMAAFTYHVAHDLRAPLRAIIATARLLQMDYADSLDSQANELLDRQVRAGNKLGTLIDELLKLSRLNQEEAVRTRVDLSAIAREVAEELRDENPQIEIRVEPDMEAYGDPRLLRLLFANLLQNALRYSPEGGVVSVGRGEDGAYYVRDQGIGFDMQYAHKLFLPFERLVSDAEFPGTGVGLANVARIVAKHRGRVWAEGRVGEGATFYFTLGDAR